MKVKGLRTLIVPTMFARFVNNPYLFLIKPFPSKKRGKGLSRSGRKVGKVDACGMTRVVAPGRARRPVAYHRLYYAKITLCNLKSGFNISYGTEKNVRAKK
jgi:hypothetical protein